MPELLIKELWEKDGNTYSFRIKFLNILKITIIIE